MVQRKTVTSNSRIPSVLRRILLWLMEKDFVVSASGLSDSPCSVAATGTSGFDVDVADREIW